MYGYIDSNGNKHLLGFIPVTEADEINFDNSNTDLQSTDVQGAIEELTSAENIAYDSNNSVKDKIDEFRVITGKLANTSAFSDAIQLPNGFTTENTIIASLQIKTSNNTWRSGNGAVSSSFSRNFVQISLDGNNNSTLMVFNNESSVFGADYKVLIKKIS